ncbi:hypothetical protein PPL_02244 [Heterostelium album PN500]|uniref:F-box domain-containing protein n=1 Tax=Heterostelium pallidum (strain ATCC 26659 / Pp 5 / PN500) TaxID=670386 RepID=D3B1S0_HETP5|nr:hypothetical protein PPL_02244 [Heterostelium album PN500]EFA85244.1 hypothetical protein PPL_02244 [Heterostelium album PN500]|eukprot:XP_020437353.1 hypothetical protein PPL_02244 [Heterostelium album PN500]
MILNNNNNNILILPKIIQKLILSLIFNHRKSLLSLSNYIESYESRNNYYTLFNHFKEVSFRNVLRYALVCKDWFTVVSGLCNRYYMVMPITFHLNKKQEQQHENNNNNQLDLKQRSFINNIRSSSQQNMRDILGRQCEIIRTLDKLLSSQYSVFRFENIVHLYIDTYSEHYDLKCYQSKQQEERRDENEYANIIEYIKRFPKLERLTIKTESVHLVNDLMAALNRDSDDHFQQVKIEVYVKKELTPHHEIMDLSMAANQAVLEYFSDINRYYEEFVKKWRCNSISIEFDDGEHEGGINHISYRELFRIHSLKSVNISSREHIYLDELEHVLIYGIESFRGNVAFGLLGHDDSLPDNINNEVEEEWCACLPYDDSDIQEEDESSDNDDSFEMDRTAEVHSFIDSLDHNKTLKQLLIVKVGYGSIIISHFKKAVALGHSNIVITKPGVYGYLSLLLVIQQKEEMLIKNSQQLREFSQ